MKTTTIRKNVATKMENWLATIGDVKLRDDVRKGITVSGGCIASMFLREQVNDYDVYLSDIDLVKRVALYYTKPFGEHIRVLDGREKSVYEKDFEYPEGGDAISIRTLKPNQIKLFVAGGGGFPVTRTNTDELKYQPAYFSPNAISLTDNLQIVLRFYGNHEEVHRTFDFIHATNYFTFADGLVTNVKALESLLTKTLLYQGSLYPLTSIIRAKKFIKRGFNITAGEYLKIMFQISQLDLTDPDVLEEQLIGVDVAYFDLLVKILRERLTSRPDFGLSSAYLNEIIDRIFSDGDLTDYD